MFIQVLQSCLICALALLAAPALGRELFGVASFFTQQLCQLQARLEDGCAQLKAYRAILECASACYDDAGCVGVSEDHLAQCYHHGFCAASLSDKYICKKRGDRFVIYVKEDQYPIPGPITTCQNGGWWKDADQVSCRCSGGWVGQYCERYPKSCLELIEYGHPSGYKWTNISLDNYPQPIYVRCNLQGEFANMYIMFNSGEFKFNKNWQEYADGFHFDENNFWLGLNKIKALNDAGFTLLFLDTLFTKDYEYNMIQSMYRNFRLNLEATWFKFTFYNATIMKYGQFAEGVEYADCLGPVQNTPFSTYDRDKDALSCSQKVGAGWWFKSCQEVCNPLGYKVQKLGYTTWEELLRMPGLDFSQPYGDRAEIVMYFQSFQGEATD